MYENSTLTITRNSYGEGEKTAEYELTIEGELEEETFQIEVGEQKYTKEETQKMFRTVMKELDKVVLGENKS